MKTHTQTPWLAALVALAVAGLASRTRGDVVAYTLGIDVNCPAGLGE
jgi:hypothetical protein